MQSFTFDRVRSAGKQGNYGRLQKAVEEEEEKEKEEKEEGKGEEKEMMESHVFIFRISIDIVD